ncbi:hypothetical protein SteCoe_22431 [Stentor coeruleus]|uniref:EF-hand domain-containing protein n=1 Tax=Stentor coeruleus TaxID=5963 RepID=A0A1R2BMC3_9CILI|nr:hypothetical protein SteCoe_22431 [Stentor coeruleus]
MFPFATTQTELKTSYEFKPLPKLQVPKKQETPRRMSMKPYYYNEIGDICVNPLPSMITCSTSPVSPLKYRTLGIKFDDSPINTSTISKKFKRKPLSPFTIKLKSSLNFKEVFVMENGTNIKDNKFIGFAYSITRRIMNRQEKYDERKSFLEKCRYEFNTAKKFKFIFSVYGKIYNFLQDIPFNEKLVLVSVDENFRGINDNGTLESINDSKMSKSLITQIEEKFVTKTSVMSNKPFEFSRTFPKTPNKITRRRKGGRLNGNQLKVKLGQTAVKIDMELPKLYDIGMKKIKEKVSFGESEIHKLYARYKMLVHLSVGQNPGHTIKDGISKNTFIESYHGTSELNFVLGRIFECIDQDRNGNISWEEYLSSMDIMCNGTYEQQIDLFFQVYDLDCNGCLSFEEIRNLCKLQLQKADAGNVIEELSHSFASLIFDITETSYDKEIPADKIKKVLTQQTDKSLIEMFCSFTFMQT